MLGGVPGLDLGLVGCILHAPHPKPTTHPTCSHTTQAGAAGVNDRHWADGRALLHQAVLATTDDDDKNKNKESEEWAELLAWLVAASGKDASYVDVDVNVRSGGGLLAG